MATKNIEQIIKKNVLNVIGEVLSDPDFGLEFKRKFVKKIKKSLEEVKKGKVYSLKEL